MAEDTSDYTTIAKVPGTNQWMARRMSWDSRAGGYIVRDEMGPWPETMAERLALTWAVSYHWEYRS